MSQNKKGLQKLFEARHIVTIAEGYIYALERQGYCQAGAYVPEVVLEHPDIVKKLYEEFVHAGSDIVVACTYFANREKLRIIGREADVERLNEVALRLARQVADANGKLMAGDICNTTAYNKEKPEENDHVKEIFKEQVLWAVRHGADLILCETFYDLGEAMLALEAVKMYGDGLPAIVQMTPLPSELTYDGVPIPEALRRLEEAGAAAVGLNCSRGPDTMLPIIKKCREVVKGPLGCVPVPYRTTADMPIFQALTYPGTDKPCYTTDLDIYFSGRGQITEFAKKVKEMGLQYVGLCCGNMGAHFRALCEGLGRKVPASRFSPDFSKHFALGDDDSTAGKSYNKNQLKKTLSQALLKHNN